MQLLPKICSQWLLAVWRWLQPPTCVICLRPSATALDLCPSCKPKLPWIEQACYRCGHELRAITKETFCGKCLQQPPIFDRTIALFQYRDPINFWITGLKFHERLLYSRLFGELLAEKIKLNYQDSPLPELVIPVPLHTKRLKQRGFNQALEIANFVAKNLTLKIDIKSCQRLRHTAAQSSLSGGERKRNVKKAFAIKKPISAKHVAIIDDVMTTGNTVNELAKSLKQADVQRIDIWCCTRVD